MATPYSPEGKGKIEKFFNFVQSDFFQEAALSAVSLLLCKMRFRKHGLGNSHKFRRTAALSPSVVTLDDLNQSLLAWLEVIYHRKVHSETGQSPLDRFRQDTSPSLRPVDPLTLRNAFLFRASRRVSKTGTFDFQGNRYTAPGFLVGQTIQLHYDPFDLSVIEIWFNNQRLDNAQAARLQTTVQPGLTPDPTPPPPKPTTGTDYLAMLRQERERLLREQLPPIPFTRLPSDQADSSQE